MSAGKDLVVTPDGAEYATETDRLHWIERGKRSGWLISEFSRLDAGATLGPCTQCRKTCARYGEFGNPLCPTCTSARTNT